jgi:PTH1 family peptidyl-tRNA hydrolase
MHAYGMTPSDLTVVYDDMDLPPGQIRVRRKGGAGGHRGVRSVIETLQTEVFDRVRVGIGKSPRDADTVEYVLSPFTDDQHAAVKQAVETAADALEMMIRDDVEKAMNFYNDKGRRRER